MNGIPLISTPMTETWVAWVMLLLLCLPALALLFQPMMISTGFRTLFTVKERDSIFIATSADPRAEVSMIIYGFGVAAMLLYAMFFTGQYFSPLMWLIILGLILAVKLLQFILLKAVAYTFFEHSDTDVFQRHYRYLTTCVLVLLYPITLVTLYWPQMPKQWIIAGLLLLAAFYLLVLTVKTCVLFMNGIKTILYTILYICTLEVLPIALLIYVAEWIINEL